ncbi:hypothetical protein [Herbidospora solisilvae]|nr:hypothetical protein [Herbidospora solisilvae]
MCGLAHAVAVRGSAPADQIDTPRRYLATLFDGVRPAPPQA